MHSGLGKGLSVLAAVLAFVMPCCCTGLGTYVRDRALDLTDIVDPKVGAGPGLAVKIELTDYAGLGLGLGAGWGTEFYGRARDEAGGLFLQVLAGGDEFGPEGYGPGVLSAERNVLLQWREYGRVRRPLLISRFRAGGEVWILAVFLGVYINFGELYDFLAGAVGFDPAGDDGVAKGASLQEFYQALRSPAEANIAAVTAAERKMVVKFVASDVESRRTTARDLGGAGGPGAMAVLVAALEDQDRVVKIEALRSIAKLVGTRPPRGWRTAAAADYVPENAPQIIIPLLEDRDAGVREAAAEALTQITGKHFGADHAAWKGWWEG